MSPMQCERTRQLLGAFLDQELDLPERRDVAAHLEACAQCTATADEISRVSRQLAEMGREPPPKHLRSRITAALAEADNQWPSRMKTIVSLHLPSLVRQAAVIVFACGLTAIMTATLISRSQQDTQLERDVVSAHVRSLLQDKPFQVASSDSHTVKPWFTGRIDFSPPVKDLSSEGFQLLGGRVDYVGAHRVATLVYRRHLHIVNVFMWPSASSGEVAPRADAFQGYNLSTWSSGGLTYWAISDLNGEELRQLQSLLG
jgi:anti-sigma factor RsiW